MTDLATRLIDAAYDARAEEFYRVSPFDVYRRQARAAVASTLKLFAAHIGPPWPSHEADGLHTAWTEALKIVNDLEQK